MIHCLIKLVKLFQSVFFIFCLISSAQALDNRLLIASSTSTYDSGLAHVIKESFENKYKIPLHFLIQGTGQAIKTAMRGDVDVLIVHHKKLEEKFVSNGYGSIRFNLMYNYFVIVGPKEDPADVKHSNNIEEVMNKLYKTKYVFISRADKSGTHEKELKLWSLVELDNNYFKYWYKKVGAGMGTTLNIASQMNGYTLSDYASWENFNNKGNLEVLFESDDYLINQYGLVLVSPKFYQNINAEGAKVFAEWILSDDGEKLINNYKLNNKSLFIFNGDQYK